MAMKLSTGLRNQLLDTAALRTIFNLGFIKIYNGTPPPDADTAFAGTLLNTYSNNATGTGLTFETSAASGSIPKKASETWSGTSVAAGTASYFRLVAAGDTGVLSTTQPRIQGLCGLAGSDLNLPTVTILITTLYAIDNFAIGIPTL